MARVNYNDYQDWGEKIPYFGLKNDSDYAIVQFPFAHPEELDMQSVHVIDMQKYKVKVDCLRESEDEPYENCPLCCSGMVAAAKIFIPVYVYSVFAADGVQDVYAAQIWERPISLVATLNTLARTLNDLRDHSFIITRHGRPRDTQTKYDITVNQAAEYDISNVVFPEIMGNVVKSYSYPEMENYIATGDFSGSYAASTRPPVAPRRPMPQRRAGY